MKTKGKWSVFAAMIATMVVTALFLRHIDRSRHLGNPGLIMRGENVYCEDGRLIATNTIALPQRVLDYTSTARPITKLEVDWLPSDTTFARRLYVDESSNMAPLQVTVVMMGLDRTSIHKPEYCLTGQGWSILKEKVAFVTLRNKRKLPVKEIVAERVLKQPDGREEKVRAVYMYWFVADQRITASHFERMWWMAKHLLLTGELQRWAYVSVLSYSTPGKEAGLIKRMESFIHASTPMYHKMNNGTVFSNVE
ncbi:exosortase-associated EpsI family protein [bacterium]|nr:exosortase-associated EpsI family protein [bacterium]